MKLFISWSGPRSQALAQALRDWLPLVLHYAEPWLSESDLAAGERWAQSLAKELESCQFGIICVTRENVVSPWVLFEAGSLAKSLEGSRVIPLLLDVEFSELTGPLAQFQAKKSEREGVIEVIQSVNQACENAVPETRVKALFEALWPDLEKKISEIPDKAAPVKSPIRGQHEVLEELVAGFRVLEARVRELQEVVGEAASRPSRAFRRMHPMMAIEMAHMICRGPEDPMILLVLASSFRDELPWLYDLGVMAYREIDGGHPEKASRALDRFRRAVEGAMHGPVREFLGDSKGIVHALRELLHLLESGVWNKRLGRRPRMPERQGEPDAEAT